MTGAFDNEYAALGSIMRNEPIDFISVDYAIDRVTRHRRRSGA